MEHKKKLDDLHKESLKNIDAYLETKKNLSDQDKQKIDKVRKDWEEAWVNFQEMLVYLESLEI